MKPFKAGTRVRKTMGIPQMGTVLASLPSRERWSDGTYSYPANCREAVGVFWDDGTEGIAFKRYLEVVPSKGTILHRVWLLEPGTGRKHKIIFQNPSLGWAEQFARTYSGQTTIETIVV